MRIDISHLALPEPEAVLLLKGEVRRLRGVIAASQSVLTDVERVAIEAAAKIIDASDEEMDGFSSGAAATLRGLLERTTGGE